jgi:hypothetical protein
MQGGVPCILFAFGGGVCRSKQGKEAGTGQPGTSAENSFNGRKTL